MLFGCASNTSGLGNITDGNNHDIDNTDDVTDDGDDNEHDEKDVEDENVEEPSEYDSFSGGTITRR